MFEKESVEYLKKEGAKSAQIFSTMLEEAPLQITSKQIPYIFATVAQAFQDGAEYGYNKALEEATHNYNAIIADYDKRIAELAKANEWHYPSKGEYPKDNSFVLVWTEDGGITTNYGEEYSDGISENGLFQGIHISDVIAWKEIVLPKEIKEK